MFHSQVRHYTEKYNKMKGSISAKSVEHAMNLTGMSEEDIKTGLMENSSNFRNFAFQIAKSMMPGRVSCATYAAVIAYLADKYGVEYKVMVGFCLPKSSPVFDREVEAFNKRKAEGVEHPVFANHVYVEINGASYEYFNGDTANIEHIDCIVMQ